MELKDRAGGDDLKLVSHEANYFIRKAVTGDAEAACEALSRSIVECCAEDHLGDVTVLRAWLANKTPENVRSWIESEGYMVVAECRGKITGVAMLHSDGMIVLCYLVPEARFQGIGKALLSSLEGEALCRGFKRIQLESTKTGHPFYRRNGYVDTGRERVVMGIKALGMMKEL